MTLRTVLAELSITATATTQLLVGAQLATVPLDEFSFAVAVLPASGPDGTPARTPATIFLEAGITLGRGMPLIVLAEDPNEELPILGGLDSNVWTVSGAKDKASIRLHLTLFTKVLEVSRPPGDFVPRLDPPSIPSTGPYETSGEHPQGLENEALDLLRSSGATVEAQVVSSKGDHVDAVAIFRGAERTLGPVLVEIKALRGQGLTDAINQLATYLGQSGAAFGLVVYDGPRQLPSPIHGLPIVAIHIEDLRELVSQGTLGSTLIYSRNEIAHGMPR